MMLLLKIIGFIILVPAVFVLLVVGSVIFLSMATAIYDAIKAKEADKKRIEENNEKT